MNWGARHLLGLLWLLIPLAWLILLALRRRERRLARLLDPEIIPVLAPFRKAARARTQNAYWLLAVACCLVALARPQWGFKWEEVKRRGLDILVVLDTSRSMLAEDIKPNRLQQAKYGVRDLVRKLKGDRIGLITFAGSSFLQCPLTVDYAAFLMMLDDVYAGIIPRGGTAIGQALKTAINSFEYDTQADRVIILVTDGEDHEGQPMDLADDLKKKGILLYAIGVGTQEGGLVPTERDAQGQPVFLKYDNKVISSALHEDVLQQLALATGGIYVRSSPGDFGLERIYDAGIQHLQRADQESRTVKIYEDRFMWFVGAALLLLGGECVLAGRLRKRRPVPGQEAAAP